MGERVVAMAMFEATCSLAEVQPVSERSERVRDVIKASEKAQTITVDDLAREVGPLAFRVACKMLGDPAAAEDALHDAYIQAHRGLKGFRGESSPKTWFMRIVVNSCKRHRRLWRRWVLGFDDRENEVGGEATEPVVGDPGLRERLERAVLSLPHRQRTAFVLRYTQELSTREVAEIMGCAEGTVKATLHKAVHKLRAELADLGEE